MKKILSILLAVFLIISVTIIANPVSVNAAPWLTDYTYRKAITLSHSSGAVTNHQMPLHIMKNEDFHLFDFGWSAKTNSIYKNGAYPTNGPSIIKIGSTYFMYTAISKIAPWTVWYISLSTASSIDGPWTTYAGTTDGVVLSPGAAGKWDGLMVCEPFVILDGGTYYLFYSGSKSGIGNQIGYATSPDGYTWTRQTVNAPMLAVGAGGQWDDTALGDTTIVLDAGTYYLFYFGNKGTVIEIGVATSSTINGAFDGATSDWSRSVSNPVVTKGAAGTWDSTFVADNTIIKYGSLWIMCYMGGNGTFGDPIGAQLGLATSTDLITWTKSANNPVFGCDPNNALDYANAYPNWYVEGNTHYMFGQDAPNNCIARSKTMTPDYLDRVVLNGKCQDDFDDVRFTKSDGTSLLDYWVETLDSGIHEKIWIEFDSIGTGATTFELYYSNAAATTVSSGADTFIKFDDFERGNNGDAIGGDWTVTHGAVTISTDHTVGGTRSARIVGDGATYPIATIPVTPSNNIAIHVKIWHETTAEFYFQHGDGTHHANTQHSLDGHLYYYDTGFRDLGIVVQNAWLTLELNEFNWVAGTYDIFNMPFNKLFKLKDNALHQHSADSPNVVVINGYGSAVGADTYIDNFIVRNWLAVEPVWGTWGSEEYVSMVSASKVDTMSTAGFAKIFGILWSALSTIK
jgi:hypothetical protein